jgi:hypothetical protein
MTVASFQSYHIDDIEVATAALVEHESEHRPTSNPIRVGGVQSFFYGKTFMPASHDSSGLCL